MEGIGDPLLPSQWLEERKIGFRAGMATPQLVDKLQIVNNFVFDIHTELPVPSAFLISADRKLQRAAESGC